MQFYQRPPELANQYDADSVLKNYLKRVLPKEMVPEIEADLHRMGERAIKDIWELGVEAEAQPPVHVPYDPWGKRIDQIKVSKAWEKLDAVSAEEGLVAIGYERKHGEFSRLHQFAKLYLFHPSSAIYTCPLAMTDGAARLIEVHGSSELKARAYKKLTSRDPKNFWTSGQWMTERTGGSDVSGTSTIAKAEGEIYRLYGVKWFTSATTSQMAMTLGKIEGDDKLSLFYLELRNEKNELQNIQVNRLKDKLGTRALPTAELTLNGTPAVLVGERGKGVKTIATLFNITRIYNACCAVGYMRRGIALAIDYAKKRRAFGKLLMEHPLHVETLAQMQLRFEVSFLLAFHGIHLLGKEETGKSSETESGTLRLLIPLAKLFTAKEAVAVVSEALECFGGAGYIEDTGLPKLLRDTQVLSIWEGTTNVLSLDALRAIRKENAGEAFMQELQERLDRIEGADGEKDEIKSAMGKLSRALASRDEEVLLASARTIAVGLARTYAAALLLEFSSRENARRWIKQGLYNEELVSGESLKHSREMIR